MTAENRRFLLPPIINRILTLLTEQGFAAYVVGGAVRDLLLGKAPGDFDVATSARPESVISILEPAGFTVVGAELRCRCCASGLPNGRNCFLPWRSLRRGCA
mgnify:CR=1 FL=1